MTFLLFQGLKNITAMAFDCAICENLKSFFRNKPPMVLFVISLGTFALVLLTLAYIIKVQELPNPDLTKVQTTELILVLGFLFGFFFCLIAQTCHVQSYWLNWYELFFLCMHDGDVIGHQQTFNRLFFRLSQSLINLLLRTVA